jgi:hypothetical protein
MSQITCIQIFTYKGLSNKIWAFKMMQFAHKHFLNVEGLTFYKLMGSGKGMGFNPLPDWSTYALLTVWEEDGYADDFFNNSNLFHFYKVKASSIKCHYMKCIKSHGVWSGQNPFKIHNFDNLSHHPIGVITRATIKKRHLLKFWNYVPHSTKALNSNDDLIYTKGVGEIPIIQMATFSIWKNMEAIVQFAYRDKHHKKAVEMTKKYQWYKEEMFSRFEIYKSCELIKQE